MKRENHRIAGETVVVVPCFNEADRLPANEFLAFMEAHPRVSFLFVDDGSADDTATLLSRLVDRSRGRCRVLSLAENVGKGEAVRRGLLAALEGAPAVVGYWDADLSTPLAALPALRDHLLANDAVDWVLGSRVRLLGRRIERQALRHYAGRGFATLASLILRLPVYDTQCGAKLFRATPELESLLGTPFGSRWAFDVELLARLTTRTDRSETATPRGAEYPLEEWRDVPGSSLRLRDGITVSWDLLRIWRRYRRRRSH
ncbi:MAG: glycosyltransferase [Gemmatimonadota bacterium]